MKTARRSASVFASLIATAIVVAACTGASSGASRATPEPARSVAPGSGGVPAGSAPGATTPSSIGSIGVLDQGWATTPLVDVTTGETFRIADLAGKVVIVETMAIWCTNCQVQQTNVDAALTRLPADRVAYIVLDVDPNEKAESLARYRAQNGFQGRYAIAGAAVARALAADFGDQFLNPPSTPIAVVGTDGTVTRAAFGQKSADQIVALATAAGA